MSSSTISSERLSLTTSSEGTHTTHFLHCPPLHYPNLVLHSTIKGFDNLIFVCKFIVGFLTKIQTPCGQAPCPFCLPLYPLFSNCARHIGDTPEIFAEWRNESHSINNSFLLNAYVWLSKNYQITYHGDRIASMGQGQYHQHTTQNAEQTLSSTACISV